MARKRINWERDMPLGALETLNKEINKPSSTVLRNFKKKEDIVTSLSTIRSIAKVYTRKTGIPITVSAEPFDKTGSKEADGLHMWVNGKSHIYLHPVLQCYPEKYICGVIEHELDHARIEEEWDDIL